MKTIRAFRYRCLLIAALLTTAGCATTNTSHHDTDATYLTSPEKNRDNPATEALWWSLQNALVAGGEALGGH